MKLVTIFIVCAIDSILNPIKCKVEQVIGCTIEDPKIIHARQNQEKILYWQGIECSDKYPVDNWVNELCSHYPSFIVYSVVNTSPKFYEKYGWLIGLVGGGIFSFIFWALSNL